MRVTVRHARNRKLCPKNLCHLRGSPHKTGTNREQIGNKLPKNTGDLGRSTHIRKSLRSKDGLVFYPAHNRRSSVQICPPQPILNGLKRLRGCSPLSRCFLRQRFEIPKDVLLSGKGVRDRDASNLLSILKVFTVKNATLTLDCRSDDQRIVPRQLEPGSNS